MKNYFERLRTHIAENPPDFGDGDSVLAFLYEVYNEIHSMDDAQTKADFRTLYQAMNGMTLQEMDTVLDPVCALCRDHQRSGFVEGIRIGVRLREDLAHPEAGRNRLYPFPGKTEVKTPLSYDGSGAISFGICHWGLFMQSIYFNPKTILYRSDFDYWYMLWLIIALSRIE